MKKTIEFHFDGGIASEGTVPVELVINALQSIQNIVYLLAAAKKGIDFNIRFRPSKEIKKDYLILCEVPKAGSHTQVITIEEPDAATNLFSSDIKYIGEQIGDIYQLLNDRAENKIISCLSNPRYRNRVMSYVRNSLPQLDSNIFVTIPNPNNNNYFDSRNIQKTTTKILEETQNEIEECMTTVTGYLNKIDFSKKELTITYPPTNKALACYYNESIEEMLLENRRGLVQITGNVILDDNDTPKIITDVISIQEIDLTVIDLEKFEYDDKVLLLKEAKQLKPELDEDKQLYTLKDESLGIDVYAYNRNELKEYLKEQLEFLWTNYAIEEDINLTTKAIELKNNLIKNIIHQKIER